MARKISSRTVVNRKALSAISAGFVDGLEELGRTIVERVEPPDDPATKERIVGDYGVWANGRKVAGGASKPRAARVKEGITLIVGYPFPMRLQELGSVHQPARPVFSPVAFAELPGMGAYLKPPVRARLATVK